MEDPRRGGACQPYLQITDRQIPHSQVQLLHFSPGEVPRAGTASGTLRGSKPDSFLMDHGMLMTF